jgi:mRNA-degrading endonuclease RelE of RelBE toxin-antitoxin system
MYHVKINKKAQKGIEKMPVNIRQKMVLLIDDLREIGPILNEWSNFSKLSKNEYHCHLSYKWIACWRWENNTILIEVYYAGSREDAPY